MGDQISMALDDIIRANKMVFPRGGGGAGRKFIDNRYTGGGRGGSGAGGWFRYGRTGSFLRGRNRGGISKSSHYYRRGDVDNKWQHDMYNNFDEWNSQTNVTKFVPADSTGSTKLLISNLDFGVSSTDIRELFSECGSLKSAAVHYDRSGRSLGTAEAVFERGADAWKAMKQYHGVLLDGKPMSVQLAKSEHADTLGNDLRRGIGGGRSDGGPVWGNTYRGGAYRYHSFGSSRGYVRRSWGRSWSREGYGAGRGWRPVPTAEELDAELDAYVKI